MAMRPKVLTIAGFDPSGGAGILADIKTFEQHGCLGMAVQTANTIQTEDEFKLADWLNKGTMLRQLDLLLMRYDFDFAKIGLIRDVDTLKAVVERLRENDVKIIWDTVFSISAGSTWLFETHYIEQVLPLCELITPNKNELERICERVPFDKLLTYTAVLEKGGHAEDIGSDILHIGAEIVRFEPQSREMTGIHGSGCILSAAVTANLAKGMGLSTAIAEAKKYIEERLTNKTGLLTYHT